MHTPAARSRRPTHIALAMLALLLVFLVLLALPLAEIGARLRDYSLVRAALNRTPLLFAAGGVVAVSAAIWLIVGQKSRVALASLSAALLGLLVLGAYAFQVNYPNAAVFSLERYRSSSAILLGTDAALSEVAPASTLVLPREPVERADFPVIDVHFHLESLASDIDADRLVRAMDAAGIDKVVNLGGVAGMFEGFAETFYAKYPDRFILFAKPDPGAVSRPNGVERDLEWLKKVARMGARGLKESKSFGMSQRDADGKIIPVDDPRMAPVWELAGALGMPVLIHTGEPVSFWDPIDVRNERYLELLQHPEWSLIDAEVPSREELMQQRERLLARHPGTNFIGAHFGMNGNDLEYVARLLDTYPNYYVDMSSVLQELGRQPYSTRRFIIRYQDRILFGTDGGFGLQSADAHGAWTPERMFRSYLEFFQTGNEYIEYPMADVTKQGTWRIYGIDLPADVLEKVYARNAERLIPSHAEVVERLDRLN